MGNPLQPKLSEVENRHRPLTGKADSPTVDGCLWDRTDVT